MYFLSLIMSLIIVGSAIWFSFIVLIGTFWSSVVVMVFVSLFMFW